MLYIFEDRYKSLYNNPDNYIFSLKNTVKWGDKLKVYPVYQMKKPALSGFQEIYASFYHEGTEGSVGSTEWICPQNSKNKKEWYNGLDDIEIVDRGKVVYFDFGSEYPCYFKTKQDLIWFISNIYHIYEPLVCDELSDLSELSE